MGRMETMEWYHFRNWMSDEWTEWMRWKEYQCSIPGKCVQKLFHSIQQKSGSIYMSNPLSCLSDISSFFAKGVKTTPVPVLQPWSCGEPTATEKSLGISKPQLSKCPGFFEEVSQFRQCGFLWHFLSIMMNISMYIYIYTYILYIFNGVYIKDNQMCIYICINSNISCVYIGSIYVS